MAFLTGWSYRKSITLSRASGAVTNYQMKLLVGESAGAVGENVDCGGLCKTDFSDLRFTAADGTTLLDYWIESVSGTTPNQLATVWVEFDSIGTGATTFYMYYGNAGAAAASSGANTFIVFDDFERGANNDAVGGSWTVTQGLVRINTAQKYGGTRSAKWDGNAGSAPIATIPVTPSADISVRRRVYKPGANSVHWAMGNGSKVAYCYTDTSENILTYNGAGQDTGVDQAADDWALLEFNNFNFTGGTFDVWHNGTKIVTGAAMWTDASWPNIVRMTSGETTGGAYNDDFLVRNWRATGPAWGSWGAKEDAPVGGAVMNNQFFVMLLAGGGR